MSIRLVYHTPESMNGGTSPFDAIVMESVAGYEVRLACPYLGLEYLTRLTKQARGWRLITDVSEWLRSCSAGDRTATIDFIQNHNSQIHHCQDLHAKVLIAGGKALAGSANFTRKGMLGRVEMGVCFENCDHVDELRKWFDGLWTQTAVVDRQHLLSYLSELPPPEPWVPQQIIPCVFPGVEARLSMVPRGANSQDPDAEERLISRLRLAPSRRWAENWLDLAKELLDATELDNDDPRLSISLPNSRSLPITINSRYVLTAFRLERGNHEKTWLIPNYRNPPDHAAVELIVPASFADSVSRLPNVIRHSRYDPSFAGETRETVPHYVSFSMPSEFNLSSILLDAFLTACRVERNHQQKSHFRRYHKPIVYRAIMDSDYRRLILNRAFSPI